MEAQMHTHDTETHSDVQSFRAHDVREGRHEPESHSIEPTKSFLQFLIEIRTAEPSLLAAVAFGLSASLFLETVHAQEYPWCLSREGYLYCFYKTQEQCQWTAGIGGCALNPRLLFPNKPRDSSQGILSHMK